MIWSKHISVLKSMLKEAVGFARNRPAVEEDVVFTEKSVEFLTYPYPPASLFPSGSLPYESIREVLPDQAPPEIRTVGGEVLFVSAMLRDKLVAAAKEHDLPIVSRVDVWHLILEPFLDTECDDAKAIARLEATGVPHAECEALREYLRDAMVAYNIESGLGDWVHLGLSDALDALLTDGPFPACHEHALPPDDYRSFYDRAMEMAERGRLKATDVKNVGGTTSLAS